MKLHYISCKMIVDAHQSLPAELYMHNYIQPWQVFALTDIKGRNSLDLEIRKRMSSKLY